VPVCSSRELGRVRACMPRPGFSPARTLRSVPLTHDHKLMDAKRRENWAALQLHASKACPIEINAHISGADDGPIKIKAEMQNRQSGPGLLLGTYAVHKSAPHLLTVHIQHITPQNPWIRSRSLHVTGYVTPCPWICCSSEEFSQRITTKRLVTDRVVVKGIRLRVKLMI
jgi:hypothetical protein